MAVVAMASSWRASDTCTLCRRCATSSSSPPNKAHHFSCFASKRNPPRSTSSPIFTSPPFPLSCTDPKFRFGYRNFACNAVEGNSTSRTTANAELPSSDKELSADIGEVSAKIEEEEIPAKVSNQMSQERAVSGGESPSKTEEFWRGVLEETRLIEWPSLQKVLGTTGVVTSIILGASLVLLTVNALLAQLSDAVFKNAPPA